MSCCRARVAEMPEERAIVGRDGARLCRFLRRASQYGRALVFVFVFVIFGDDTRLKYLHRQLRRGAR